MPMTPIPIAAIAPYRAGFVRLSAGPVTGFTANGSPVRSAFDATSTNAVALWAEPPASRLTETDASVARWLLGTVAVTRKSQPQSFPLPPGGSITSLGRNVDEWVIQESAPWNRQYDGFLHGYAYLDATHQSLVTEYRASDRFDPGGATSAFERFTQVAGSNQISRQQL